MSILFWDSYCGFFFSVHKQNKTNKKPNTKPTFFIILSVLQIPVDIRSRSLENNNNNNKTNQKTDLIQKERQQNSFP